MMAHLKKRKLTTNYSWNLNYTTPDSGYLVIGDYPHNFDPDKYKKDDMKQINVHIEKEIRELNGIYILMK
jgi:hypothetical protein